MVHISFAPLLIRSAHLSPVAGTFGAGSYSIKISDLLGKVNWGLRAGSRDASVVECLREAVKMAVIDRGVGSKIYAASFKDLLTIPDLEYVLSGEVLKRGDMNKDELSALAKKVSGWIEIGIKSPENKQRPDLISDLRRAKENLDEIGKFLENKPNKFPGASSGQVIV